MPINKFAHILNPGFLFHIGFADIDKTVLCFYWEAKEHLSALLGDDPAVEAVNESSTTSSRCFVDKRSCW